MKKLVTITSILLLLSVICNLWQYYEASITQPLVSYDTLETIRFISVKEPVPADSLKVKEVIVRLPVYITAEDSDKVCDTCSVVNDSAEVVVPIIQKVYQDSIYTAYVSGFRPNLDSIFITRKEVYVTKTITEKRSRWGIGLQGGYGITPKGFQPYLGVGVTYNFFPIK